MEITKQTAVEFYISKIKEARYLCDDPSMEMDIWHTLEVLIKKGEQAKEMEREQIKDAYNYGHTDGVNDKPGLTSGSIYYNETYGGNK
jgi:predicted secreted protein